MIIMIITCDIFITLQICRILQKTRRGMTNSGSWETLSLPLHTESISKRNVDIPFSARRILMFQPIVAVASQKRIKMW